MVGAWGGQGSEKHEKCVTNIPEQNSSCVITGCVTSCMACLVESHCLGHYSETCIERPPSLGTNKMSHVVLIYSWSLYGGSIP